MVAVCGSTEPFFFAKKGRATGSCPGRGGARVAAGFAVTTVDLARQAAVNDRCAESRSLSTTTTTKTWVDKTMEAKR